MILTTKLHRAKSIDLRSDSAGGTEVCIIRTGNQTIDKSLAGKALASEFGYDERSYT